MSKTKAIRELIMCSAPLALVLVQSKTILGVLQSPILVASDVAFAAIMFAALRAHRQRAFGWGLLLLLPMVITTWFVLLPSSKAWDLVGIGFIVWSAARIVEICLQQTVDATHQSEAAIQ
jgi:hypothetical protein